MPAADLDTHPTQVELHPACVLHKCTAAEELHRLILQDYFGGDVMLFLASHQLRVAAVDQSIPTDRYRKKLIRFIFRQSSQLIHFSNPKDLKEH